MSVDHRHMSYFRRPALRKAPSPSLSFLLQCPIPEWSTTRIIRNIVISCPLALSCYHKHWRCDKISSGGTPRSCLPLTATHLALLANQPVAVYTLKSNILSNSHLCRKGCLSLDLIRALVATHFIANQPRALPARRSDPSSLSILVICRVGFAIVLFKKAHRGVCDSSIVTVSPELNILCSAQHR